MELKKQIRELIELSKYNEACTLFMGKTNTRIEWEFLRIKEAKSCSNKLQFHCEFKFTIWKDSRCYSATFTNSINDTETYLFGKDKDNFKTRALFQRDLYAYICFVAY